MARESFAYANSKSTNHMSRLVFFFRSHTTAVTATVGFLIFILLVTSDAIMKGPSDGHSGLRPATIKSKSWGGAAHPGYFQMQDSIMDSNIFSFAAVTDMDQLSRMEGDKPIFHSWLQPGRISYDVNSNTYSLGLDEVRELISGHNEAGRGMELSELTLYQNRLLAFDDRTGSVFELLSESPEKSFVAPRFVITEGEGDTDKGMKWEWATVKGKELYIGSMGKEYTKPDGTIVNTNNLWIAKINEQGEVIREDWADKYNFVRRKLGAPPPGYVIHEAVLWSEKLQKWLFIPRRISSEMYDDVKDEYMGTNKLLIVNEKFTDAKLVDIKMNHIDPLHGFSSAAFVPNSNDRHIVALRSVEENCAEDLGDCKQRTYIMVFDVDGNVLMEEQEISDNVKYEGIEFVDIRAMA